MPRKAKADCEKPVKRKPRLSGKPQRISDEQSIGPFTNPMIDTDDDEDLEDDENAGTIET